MELNLTPQRIAMIIGALLLSVGFYLGLTPRESNLLTVISLGGGALSMGASLFFWAKTEKEREQQSEAKFMRAMDNMPKATPEGKTGANPTAPSRVATVAGGTRIPNPNQTAVPTATATATTTATATATGATPKPVSAPVKTKPSIQDLPSFDAEEDWGVYEETNIKKKK